jgi:diaminohydroxyphosphoribosylaminopyrimidine deaminase/5-amino-6-(5-phosphoribosylamino)uracil reductase
MQAQAIEAYMRRALELAARARGKTFPNPLVGAVVVKDGRIVGEGFHHRAGAPHAEVLALKEAAGRARGGALFCTFEPCFHFGRTAPCVHAVISSGIREVYIGSRDPNPMTCGKSIRLLRRRGIRVDVGILEKEVVRLNEPFFCAMRRHRPLVTIKVAASLDGKIATRSGCSQWITGAAARHHAHRMRKYYDAIMVGIGTVLADDPGLEAGGSHRLAKVIVDSSLRLPLSARLLKTRQPVVVATVAHNKDKEQSLSARGVTILHTKKSAGGVDLADLLKQLHAMEIRHLLVEGGAALTGAFLDERLADKLVFYVAPMIIGGRQALGAVGGRGVDTPQRAVSVKRMMMQQIGGDFFIEGDLVYS